MTFGTSQERKIDYGQAIKFYQVLYKNCDQGKVEFRFLPSKRQNFFPLTKLENLHALPVDQNCYFAVATREGGGKKEHIIQIPALWADLDFKDLSQEEFDSRLKSFPLSPSIIVHSGGGYHCYWQLKEPLEKADISQVESYLKRLASYLGG